MIRALYVDDEPSLLDICRLFLQKTGEFEVTTAPSVRIGLEALEKTPYDVIVSDYQMPGMDGIAFLKLLRQQGNTTPFILFTGRGREEIVIEAINNGADFYLQKGGDPRAQFAELAHKAHQAVRRRQAEAQLKESERRYRDVVETQTEFISRFLPDGTHVFVNEAYCRHFGKTRDQVVGHRFIPAIHEEDLELVRRHFASFSPERPAADIEHRVIMPDGGIRWHWWNDHAFFDDEGKVVEFQSIGKDITTRKQAEEALRESEERWRKLLEHSPVPMALYSLYGRALFFNLQFERTVGWTVGDIPHIGSWWRTVYPDRRYREQMKNAWLGRVRRAAASGEYIEPQETCIFCKDRVTRTLEFSGLVIGGTILVTCYDLTARKRAEEELQGTCEQLAATEEALRAQVSELDRNQRLLKESETKFRAILNQSFGFIGLTTTAGILIEANEPALAFAGITVSDVQNRPFWETAWWKHSVEMQERLRDAVKRAARGEMVRFEATISSADGQIAFIDFSLKPAVDENGKVLYLIPEGRDITEWKLGEEVLKRAENLYRTVPDTAGTAITHRPAHDHPPGKCPMGAADPRIHRGEQENKVSWTIFIDKPDVERV